MHRSARWLLTVPALALASASLSLPGAEASPPPDPPKPPVFAHGVQVASVDAIAADDVWAVGFVSVKREHLGHDNVTVAEHWTGSSWQQVATPSPGKHYNGLAGVASDAANDVWAVGSYVSKGSVVHPLALHWDGSSWTQVEVTGAPGSDPQLSSVTVVSPDDAWAAGYSDGLGFVEHWDGTAWHLVETPATGKNTEFWNITATSSSEAWLVGERVSKANKVSALTEHWDGTAWTVVRCPSPKEPNSYTMGLASVSEVSPDDVWAVGHYVTSDERPLVEHWDGTSWKRFASPESILGVDLESVSAVSTDDVWAVGYVRMEDGYPDTLIDHWDGTSWTQVSSPSRSGFNMLTSVSANGTNDVWAVGHGPGRGSLVDHWDGAHWRG